MKGSNLIQYYKVFDIKYGDDYNLIEMLIEIDKYSNQLTEYIEELYTTKEWQEKNKINVTSFYNRSKNVRSLDELNNKLETIYHLYLMWDAESEMYIGTEHENAKNPYEDILTTLNWVLCETEDL